MTSDNYSSKGKFKLYCGPMFSAKSQSIIGELGRLKYIPDFKYISVKPKIDHTVNQKIYTRNGSTEECVLVEKSRGIIQLVNEMNFEINAVIIDEINLFDEEICDVVKYLIDKNVDVYGSGLDLDFRGEPFEVMKELMPMANKIKKLTAICQYNKCGKDANRTQRLINGEPAPDNSPIMLVADDNARKMNIAYEPRCQKHHEVPGKPKIELSDFL